MRRDLPARNPHEEEWGLHAEHTRRGAISVTIEAARKRKYCSPVEFQDREGRNDSLKLEFQEYLKKEKAKKRKKSRGQPPLAPRLDAPEAETLGEIDSAISENNNNQASGKRHTSNPAAGRSESCLVLSLSPSKNSTFFKVGSAHAGTSSAPGFVQ